MSQNVVERGRTKIEMPEHLYDTVDGGLNLYNVHAMLFARLADDAARCRTKAFNLAHNSSVSFAHNIGQIQGELEVKVFVGGLELAVETFLSQFEVTYTDNNTLSLKNISGSQKTGWIFVSAVVGCRVDEIRLRSRVTPPTVQTGEVSIFNQNEQIFAKNDVGTIMGLTDSTVIQCPPGVVLPFAGATVPSGFLSCDGSAVSRATYAALFAVLGTSHGQGDGATTFHLPDYRGRFLRGVDGSAGRDPDKASRTAMNSGGNSGNAVGSVQGSDFGSHTHIQNAHNHNQDSHNHNQNSHTHNQDSHNHNQNSHTHIQDPHTHYLNDNQGSSSGTPSQVIDTIVSAAYIVPDTYAGVALLTTATNQSTTATNQATTATNQSTTATNQATTAINQSATAVNNSTGGNESRPLNAFVNYIIKY